MKKLIWAALALSMVAIPSHAQNTPAGDVSVGYSYFHTAGVGFNGVSGSGAYYVNDWFGIVGDLGVLRGSGVTGFTYTAGPRFTVRKSDRIAPFVEALVGGAHVSPVNPLVYGGGGGADIALSSSGKVLLRPEVEYFGLRANGATLNGVRVSVGIVYSIGSRSR